MIPTGSELTGTDVAVCALIYFYVKKEPHNQTGPHLSRLLAFALRLIFRVDPPYASAEQFLLTLQAFLFGQAKQQNGAMTCNDDDDDDEDDGGDEGAPIIRATLAELRAIVEDAITFSGLHNYFTRIERLLLREEMFDDLENKTIDPPERQIDESSPFGHYLHQCLELYLSLEDDAFVKVVQRVDAWVHGSDEKAQQKQRRPLSTLQSSQNEGSLLHEAAKLSADEELVLAIRQGDYATARAGLEGSFDRAPSAIMGRTLPETLLHYAIFHVRMGGYETAKASLEEALRLARGNNDVDCITACDDLQRQIAFEEERARPRPAAVRTNEFLRADGSSTIKVTHKRDGYRYIDEGLPLVHIAQAIDRHEKITRKRVNGANGGVGADGAHLDAEAVCEYNLMQSEIWRDIGSAHNADVLQRACADEAILTQGWGTREVVLALSISRAASASLAGRHAEALGIMVGGELVSSMDIAMLHRWHAEVLRCVYRAAVQTGAQALMQHVESLRPEVVREVGGRGSIIDVKKQSTGWCEKQSTALSIPHSEATFARSMRKSKAQLLREQLDDARQARRSARNGAQALAMAVQVMDETQRAHMFPLYRRAVCEAAESFLSLGQTERAKSLLEDIMAQALTDAEAEVRARTTWAYARAVLAQQQGEAYVEALRWLDRAAENYKEAGMWPELSDLLYIKARVLHALGRTQVRDAVAAAHNAVQKESRNPANTQLRILHRVQYIAGLASARVVAGG